MSCHCGVFGRDKEGKDIFFSYEEIKTAWVKAEAWRWKESGQWEVADEMRSVIKDEKVDRQLFRELKTSPSWMEGTKYFVDHSSSEGFWEIEKIIKINEAIEKLEPWLHCIFKRCLFRPFGSKIGVHFFVQDMFRNCPLHKNSIKWE